MNRGFFSKLGLGGGRGERGGSMCANFSSISNSELLPHPIWFSPHQWVIGFIYPPKCLLILSLPLYLSTGFDFSITNLLHLFISSLFLSLSRFFRSLCISFSHFSTPFLFFSSLFHLSPVILLLFPLLPSVFLFLIIFRHFPSLLVVFFFFNVL